MIVSKTSTREDVRFTHIVKEAHAAGLVVHPYTFRADKAYLPPYAADFEALLELFYFKAGVDGVFTDFPDRAVEFLRKTNYQNRQ